MFNVYWNLSSYHAYKNIEDDMNSEWLCLNNSEWYVLIFFLFNRTFSTNVNYNNPPNLREEVDKMWKKKYARKLYIGTQWEVSKY